MQIHHYSRHLEKISFSDLLSAVLEIKTSFVKERAAFKQSDAVMGNSVRKQRSSLGSSARGSIESAIES